MQKFADQTRFFDKEKDTRGNCLQACLASVFGLPLAAVPDFTQSHPSDWMDDLKAWAAWAGYEWHFDSEDKVPPGMLYIVNGPSDRGVRHSTVWRDGAMVHDPHPSRAGLVARDGNVWWFARCAGSETQPRTGTTAMTDFTYADYNLPLPDCQSGQANICKAGKADGVVCPADSCDIDDGLRPAHAGLAAAEAELRREFEARVSPSDKHSEADILRAELERLLAWFDMRRDRPGCSAQYIHVGMALDAAKHARVTPSAERRTVVCVSDDQLQQTYGAVCAVEGHIAGLRAIAEAAGFTPSHDQSAGGTRELVNDDFPEMGARIPSHDQSAEQRSEIIESVAKMVESVPLTYAGPDPQGARDLRYLIVCAIRDMTGKP